MAGLARGSRDPNGSPDRSDHTDHADHADHWDHGAYTGFAAFVTSRERGLLRAAYLVCGDLTEAAAVLQTALIKLARHWHRLRGDHPDGYLRQILYREAISSWRKRAAERRRAVLASRLQAVCGHLCVCARLPRWRIYVIVDTQNTERDKQRTLSLYSADPANAGPARIEVGLPEADPETVPVLRYSYQGSQGTILGEQQSDHRWRFEVPLEASPEDQDLTWTVLTTAKTAEPISSRERVTVVQPPTSVEVPQTVRLLDNGELHLRVRSQSSVQTEGELHLTGPEGLLMTPDRVSYSIPAGGEQEVSVRYSCLLYTSPSPRDS